MINKGPSFAMGEAVSNGPGMPAHIRKNYQLMEHVFSPMARVTIYLFM